MKDEIREWGVWAYDGRGLSLGHGKPFLAPYKASRSALISDDRAMQIDGAISQLSLSHPLEGRIVAYYGLGAPLARIASEVGVSVGSVQQKLSFGIGYIEGFLSNS